MAEWVKAAEAQLETIRFLGSEMGKRYCAGWVNATSAGEPEKERMYHSLLSVEETKLLGADAIWVSPEMCEIVQMAKEGFNPEPIEREDFITPCGFLYFAEPLYMRDRHAMNVSVGAISWSPIIMRSERESETDVDGMAVTMYSSVNAEHDDFSHQHRHFMREYGAGELMPLHLSMVTFGSPLDEGELEDVDGRYTGADQWWKTVQTSLRMMQQRVAYRTDEPVARPTRRRWQRALGTQPSEVLVIRLRRPTVKHHSDEEHETREYTHRWLVDGHWRNQWYDSIKRHRQIWISPFIKGPEDKELVIKKRYYKWDR